MPDYIIDDMILQDFGLAGYYRIKASDYHDYAIECLLFSILSIIAMIVLIMTKSLAFGIIPGILAVLFYFVSKSHKKAALEFGESLRIIEERERERESGLCGKL